LKKGADPNARAYYGKTVLMAACDLFASDPAEQARRVKRLLDAGARVNDRATNGQSALMLAVQHTEAVPTIRALLRSGADPNAADRYGTTPLMYAAGVGNDTATRLLLAAGADVHRVDTDGETALARARQHGHAGVASLLQQAGARR
jgi:ankyrin repeat protein